MGALVVTTRKILLKNDTRLTQYKGPKVGERFVFPAGTEATYRKTEEAVPGLPGVKFAHHRVLIFNRYGGHWVRRKWLPLTPVRVKLLPVEGYNRPAIKKGTILRLAGNSEHPDKAVIALEGEEVFTEKWPIAALRVLSPVAPVAPGMSVADAHAAGLRGELFNDDPQEGQSPVFKAWARGLAERREVLRNHAIPAERQRQEAEAAAVKAEHDAGPRYAVADAAWADKGSYYAGPFVMFRKALNIQGARGWVIVRIDEEGGRQVVRRWGNKANNWVPPHNRATESSDVLPVDTTPQFRYAVGHCMSIKRGSYYAGPFSSLKEALVESGREKRGWVILQIDQQGNETPVREWTGKGWARPEVVAVPERKKLKKRRRV